MGNHYIKPDYGSYLGGGSFGHVYRGTYGGQPAAVKTINRHMLRKKYADVDRNEIVPFLKGLKHPNVVALLAWEDHGHELWLAMELCDSSLDCYVRETGDGLDDACTWSLLRDGACGLNYLHHNNVIHRDVRPDNMLVRLRDGDRYPMVKLTDFSLCKDIAEQPTSSMLTVWGNPHWRAPELLTEDGRSATGVRYKRTIDVFSFALVILCVCVNEAGRETISRVFSGAMVKRGEDFLALFDDYWRSEALKETMLPLLRNMMKLDSDARPSMDKVVLRIGSCLQPLTALSLGFRVSEFVGIGGDHCVIVGCEQTNTIRMLQMQSDQYCELWNKPCLPDFRYNQRKYISDGTIVTCGRYDMDPVVCWDLSMRRLHEHKERPAGDRSLRASLSPHGLVYRDKIGRRSYQLSARHVDGLYQLVVVGSDTVTTTSLRPQRGGVPWGRFLSVCRCHKSGWFAVTEHGSRLLDLFNAAGEHLHHVRLDYRPNLDNGIACTSECLLICDFEKLVINIHTWNGVRVGRVDVGKLVALDAGEDRIYGMGVCQGDTLHLALGKFDLKSKKCSVTSLHAFKICAFHLVYKCR